MLWTTFKDESVEPIWSLDVPSEIKNAVSITETSGKTVTLKASGSGLNNKKFVLKLTDDSGAYNVEKTITISTSWM